MQLGRYHLLTPLGAGTDGVAYRAEVGGDGRGLEHVELRVLTGAKADPARWEEVSRRLRLVGLLQHPNAVAVRERNLKQDPPYVALEWVDPGDLSRWSGNHHPLPASDVLALAQQLASVLTAAHRLGLAHPYLRPAALRGTLDLPRLDFTDLAVSTAMPGELSPVDHSCLPPGSPASKSGTAEGNLYSLGAILFWLLTGRTAMPGDRDGKALERPEVPVSLSRLVAELLSPDPDARPAAREVRERVTALRLPGQPTNMAPEGTKPPSSEAVPLSATVHAVTASEPVSPDRPPPRLGRYRLLEKLGQGGMGTVYRAEDETDGTVVAIKVLRSDWSAHPEHLRRFHKEARLLAEVNNPFVANLLEVNEDNGIHFLALEFVAGRSLHDLMTERGRLDEPTGLSIVADVARGLAQAHAAGIVHRDIKPDNILLSGENVGQAVPDVASVGQAVPDVKRERQAQPDLQTPLTTHHSPLTTPRVKLTDFGLARHVLESESLNVTRAGAVLGTPLYMSPEQCLGQAVDPRSDVYSLGCTLYHMLAGRPPFQGSGALAVMAMHRNDPPTPLRKFSAEVSEGVCRVVEKAMAKTPEARYADAGELLADLERLMRGEPSNIAVHPRLPACDPNRVLAYDFTWELESPPEKLWPHVSNTERLNRAVGLSAVQFSMKPDDTSGRGVRRYGHFSKLGLSITWEEHPFEWIEGRRMGVLREYSAGPFRWMVSVVEMEPHGTGTTLTHRLRLEPRGFLGRTIAAVEVGIRSKRSLERVYRRIDRAILAQGQGTAGRLLDPFEDPVSLRKAARKKLEALLDKLIGLGVDPGVVEVFGDFLATAPSQEVARIRPVALARRLGLDPDQLTAACLHGTREGLLLLLWDILCPVCRIPSEVKETLRALKEHGRCEVCRVDFDLDFARSVEMIFRAHPEVRDSELATYCIGGPAHSPHVAAQARVGPGEHMALDLSLPEGAYCLRGPQLPYQFEFRVDAISRVGRLDLTLTRPPGPDTPRVLRPGGQVLALTNDGKQELVVRVERTAPRDDALTAARASSLALFRELFPGEVLSPGQLVSVTALTFLATELVGAANLYRDLGDARAFNRVSEFFRLTEESIRREGGALVKTIGEGVLAVFSDPAAAVRVAFGLPSLLRSHEATKELGVRVGIHRGPALAATLNDHLDYFGATVSLLMRLPGRALAGEVVLSEAMAAEPMVAALAQARGLHGSVIEDGADGLLLKFAAQ